MCKGPVVSMVYLSGEFKATGQGRGEEGAEKRDKSEARSHRALKAM